MTRFRSPGRTVLAAIAAAVLAAIAGCSSSGSGSGGSAGKGGTTTVTIGIGGPVAEIWLPQFASDEGIFAKYGIKAKLVELTATTIPATLSSGKVDYMSTAGVQPETVALKGGHIKVLAVWSDKPDFQIVARAGISSVADLKGKRLGITSTGSTTTLFLEKALQKAGLSDSDVKIIPLGDPNAQMSAFASGQIDAFVGGPPASEQAAKSVKGGSLVLNFQQSYEWPFAELVGYMPYVTAHKDVTENIIRALHDAVVKWKSSPAAAESTIKHALKATDEQAKVAYESSLTTLNESMLPSVDLERTLLQSITKLVPEAANANPASLLDTSYATAAGMK